MRIKTHDIKVVFAIMTATLVMSCVKDRDFDALKGICNSDLITNATYAEVKDLYDDKTIQIQDDLIIEAYVISSDEAGNFFSVLHFQDSPSDPNAGFQIEIDLRDSHLFYPVGSKILIKLKGLYLGKSKDVFKIGGVFTSFGTISVGRLPRAILDQHIYVSCDAVETIRPTPVSIDNLQENMTNTLVQFDALEIIEEELGLSYAIDREETERTLIDCNDHEIILVNSGFSDFKTQTLPKGNGTIMGVLKRENDNYQLVIRSLEDIDFSQQRCEDLIDEFSSTAIFISELADPDNNRAARFVELYNFSSEPLSLKGWTFRRYTNANTEISSIIDLSELVIESKTAVVISPKPSEFEAVYGFSPDMGVGTNSAADSNGDDNFELVDPFGSVIDAFGVIGEDGTGTNHEFEDGRAVRNIEISSANPVYNFSEWKIYNDSGGSGTIDQPQFAPDDFSPGERN